MPGPEAHVLGHAGLILVAAAGFHGETAQGRPVSVATGPGGVVEYVRASWKAPCRDGSSFEDRTRFGAPLDLATATAVRDAGVYRRAGHGERYRITARVAGRLVGGHWSGTLSVKVLIAARGCVLTACADAGIRWTAK